MDTTPTTSTARVERSWELVAIPIVLVLLGIVAVIMVAANSGLWAWLALGIAILAALVAALLLTMRSPQHPPAWSAAQGGAARVDDGVHRVLLIPDDTCTPEGLGRALAAHAAGARTAVHVVAPALGSRVSRWTGDEHAYASAAEHLRETLEALTSLQIDANGHVGPHDPLQAADDGLREFAADEVVFAIHPAGDANWLESGVVDAARTRYRTPVSELEVDHAS